MRRTRSSDGFPSDNCACFVEVSGEADDADADRRDHRSAIRVSHMASIRLSRGTRQPCSLKSSWRCMEFLLIGSRSWFPCTRCRRCGSGLRNSKIVILRHDIEIGRRVGVPSIDHAAGERCRAHTPGSFIANSASVLRSLLSRDGPSHANRTSPHLEDIIVRFAGAVLIARDRQSILLDRNGDILRREAASASEMR